MELELLYADNHMLAVVKPAGLPVAPDESGDVSLLDLARDWLRRERKKPGQAFIGLVHRLDRPVSGVVVFGATSKGAARLSEEFRAGTVKKSYLGIGCEPLATELGNSGQWEAWLWKDPVRNQVRICAQSEPGAKQARTRWYARTGPRLETWSGGLTPTYFSFEPQTGRSHQLRVTAASLGSPLLGDLRYGAKEALPDASIALHASRLEVLHPTLRKPLVFEAPLPTTAWWRAFVDPRTSSA